MKTDVLIVGGGVIGAAIAHRLCRYNLDITVVEKESDICMGTSKANSSMLHDGYNVDSHKLKGKLVLKANPQYEQLCKDLNVDFHKTRGSIVVGFEDHDMEAINAQVAMGTANGVKGLKVVGHDEMMTLEPNINPAVKFGLLNPNTGVINPFELTMGLMENAVMNGVKVLLDTEVTAVNVKEQVIESVETTNGFFEPRIFINAAGLFSEKIAEMANCVDFKIHPRKGQYFLYDKKWGDHVKHCIYSAPTKVSKGMIILPTTEGNILAGSNATETDDLTDLATTAEGLNTIYGHTIHQIFPKLPRMGEVITTFAGLRAASNTEDFIIGHAKNVKGMINVAGIQSPGLSSAPAIAEMVDELAQELSNVPFVRNEKHTPYRQRPTLLREMSDEEKSLLIEKNPDYARIICRCETISKGEILDAIRRPIPARNLDAIKRRTRAGMGRCQGGFCGPRVLSILEEELGISPLEITKKGKNSKILMDRTKNSALLEGGTSGEKIKL